MKSAGTTADPIHNSETEQFDQEEVSEFEQSPGLPGHPGVSPLDSGTTGIHTPLKALKVANQTPRCAHVKPSGLHCGSPAMHGTEFCYYHRRVHEGPRLLYPTMTMLEDGHGIQAALMEVLCAILDGAVTDKHAALLLYGLQTAASNLKRVNDIDPDEVATEPAPTERLPEGVFQRKLDEWSGEEKRAIEDFIHGMEIKKHRRQVDEERDDEEWQAHLKRVKEKEEMASS
jgi:hypothetical protein